MSSSATTMLVFILMRPIQACSYLLAYRLTKRRDASKLVFVAALIVLGASCAALVYDTVASEPAVAPSVYSVVFLELLFWDTIMLPCCLVMLVHLPGDGNKIGALRKQFTGMKVTTLKVFEKSNNDKELKDIKNMKQ